MNTLESNVFLDPEDTTPDRMLAPGLDQLSHAELEVVEAGVNAALETMAVLDQYRVVRTQIAVHGISSGYALECDQEMPELNMLNAMYGVEAKHRTRIGLEGVTQQIRATFARVKAQVLAALRRVMEIIRAFFSALRVQLNLNKPTKVPMNQYGKKSERDLGRASKEVGSYTDRTRRISDVFYKYIHDVEVNMKKQRDPLTTPAFELAEMIRAHVSGCTAIEATFYTTQQQDAYASALRGLTSAYDDVIGDAVDAMQRVADPKWRVDMYAAAKDMYRLNTSAMKVLSSSKNQAVSDIIMNNRFAWDDVVSLEPGIGSSMPSQYADLRDEYVTKQLGLRMSLGEAREIVIKRGQELSEQEQTTAGLGATIDVQSLNVIEYFRTREQSLVSLASLINQHPVSEKHAANFRTLEKAINEVYSELSKRDSQLPDGTEPTDGDHYNLATGNGNEVEPVYEDYYDTLSDIGIASTQLSSLILSKMSRGRQMHGIVIESAIGLSSMRLRLVKRLRGLETTLQLEGAGLELHDALKEQLEGLLELRQRLFK